MHRSRTRKSTNPPLQITLTKLGEVERATRDDLDPVPGRLESPRGSMEKALREHQARATCLAFIRDHLTADLRMIGLVPAAALLTVR